MVDITTRSESEPVRGKNYDRNQKRRLKRKAKIEEAKRSKISEVVTSAKNIQRPATKNTGEQEMQKSHREYIIVKPK